MLHVRGLLSVRCFSTSIVLQATNSRLQVFKKKKPVKRLDDNEGARPTKNNHKASKASKKSTDRPNGKLQEKRESNIPILTTFESNVLKKSQNLVTKIDSFSELKISPKVRKVVMEQLAKQTVLNSQNFEKYKDIEAIDIKPSKIQTVAIHEISKNLNDKNLQIFTIAAETGSGKTWAYLTPMLEFLKQQEQSPEWKQLQRKAGVRAVILVPTQELVDQVYSNVKDLKELIDLKPFKWNFETKFENFVHAFRKRIDILITTPAKLNNIKRIRMLNNAENALSSVKFLVIDEADTLMDRSFIEDTYTSMKSMFNVQRVVLCSATISDLLNAAISKIFPSLTEPKLLISPTLHKSPKSIKYHLINSEIQPYQGSKVKALAQILYAIHSDGTEKDFEKRCIVFLNKKEDVERLVKTLKENYNHDAVGLTGDDNPADRVSKISVFVNPPRLLSDLEAKVDKKKEYKTIQGSNIRIKKNFDSANGPSSGDARELKVLVTTDIAARGLNFFGVRNVVLYNPPNTPVDLIHRVGRTGRMNQNGRVFIITDKKTKSWVKDFTKGSKFQEPSSSSSPSSSPS